MKTTNLVRISLLSLLLCVSLPTTAAGMVDESQANCNDLQSRVQQAKNAAFQSRMPEGSAGNMMEQFGVGDILGSKINFFNVQGFDQIMDTYAQAAKMGSAVGSQSMGNMFSKMMGSMGGNVDIGAFSKPFNGASVSSQSIMQSGIVSMGGNLGRSLSGPIGVGDNSGGASGISSAGDATASGYAANSKASPTLTERVRNWFK